MSTIPSASPSDALAGVAVDEHLTLDEVASAGRTALYRLYNEADEVIYIGISDDPIRRMKGHARDQPWWSEVARKTAVWYQTREAAETAETIAIGLEQPRYNKAKRYVRLPERPLAEPGASRAKPARKPVTAVATLAAAAPPAVGYGDYDEAYDPPPRWPDDMWCLSWWRTEGERRYEAVGEYLNFLAGECDALSVIVSLMERRYDWPAGAAPYLSADTAWVQCAAPGAPLAALWERSWSAHCDSWTPSVADLPADAAATQDRFLAALAAKGRCSFTRGGRRAVAAGFGSKLEAQVCAMLLADLAGARTTGSDTTGRFDAYIDAILRQGPGNITFTCDFCDAERLCIWTEHPLCPECKWSMSNLSDRCLPSRDRIRLHSEAEAATGDVWGRHHPERRSHAPLTEEVSREIDRLTEPLEAPAWRHRFPLFAPPARTAEPDGPDLFTGDAA